MSVGIATLGMFNPAPTQVQYVSSGIAGGGGAPIIKYRDKPLPVIKLIAMEDEDDRDICILILDIIDKNI